MPGADPRRYRYSESASRAPTDNLSSAPKGPQQLSPRHRPGSSAPGKAWELSSIAETVPHVDEISASEWTAGFDHPSESAGFRADHDSEGFLGGESGGPHAASRGVRPTEYLVPITPDRPPLVWFGDPP